MAESPDHKRTRRTVPAESTPISLHAANCTESPEDLQRMRDQIQEDPSLLYTAQPNPTAPLVTEPQNDDSDLDEDFELPALNIDTPPLWQACREQHLSCVKLILEATPPENVKLLDGFTYRKNNWSKKDNLLSFIFISGQNEEKMYEIMKLILQHGISPNVEIPIDEIMNPRIGQVLELYNTTKLIFPSRVVHLVVKRANSKILELLFEHGAYPDAVILTESGSVLPLYATLDKHQIRISTIEYRDVKNEGDFLGYCFLCHRESLKQGCQFLKTLLVHGATLPPYAQRFGDEEQYTQIICEEVVFPFKVIVEIFWCDRWEKQEEGEEDINYWGVKADGSVYRYYDNMIEFLELYKQFGGSLWWKRKSQDEPCEGGRGECVEWQRDSGVRPCQTIIDSIRNLIPDPEAQSMVVGEVERMMSTPLSLQQAARLAIRRSMGYGCVRNLEALPLPDHLKKYLRFIDTGV